MAYELEILRTGDHVSSDGRKVSVTSDMLRQMADTYNPSHFRAPLIVSPHNTNGWSDRDVVLSELCFGVPKALRVVGGRLKAVFDQIAPEFVNWARNGMVHSVSSSIYMPDSPSNPYPGKNALRHIAALGKTPPAVKGMAPFALSEFSLGPEAEAVSVTTEIELTTMMADSTDFMFAGSAASSLFQKLREWLIDFKSAEVADRVLPAEAISILSEVERVEYVRRDEFDSRMQLMAETVSEIREMCAEKFGLYEYKEPPMKNKKLMDMMGGASKADAAKAMGVSEEDFAAFMDGSKEPSDKQYSDLMGWMKDKKEKPASMNEPPIDLAAMQSRLLQMEENQKRQQEKLDQQTIQLNQQAQLLQMERNLLATERQAIEDEKISSFVDSLIRHPETGVGRILASERDTTIALIKATPVDTTINLSDGKTTNPRQLLMDSLKSRPPIVEFGQRVAASDEQIVANVGGGVESLGITAPAGFVAADPKEMALLAKARQIQAERGKSNQQVSFTEAVEIAQAELRTAR